MKDKKTIGVVVGLSALLIGLVVAFSWYGSSPILAGLESLEPDARQEFGASAWQSSTAAGERSREPGGCGAMSLGSFQGQVDYDEEKDYYFLQLRGARFPFKASPLDAQAVPLEASGHNAREQNTALIYGVVGPQVAYATLLVNPDEEEQVMPAAEDLARYLTIASPKKFAGLAYTSEGGNLERTVALGSQIQSWQEATAKTPKILLKGPKSGATKTRIVVEEDGRVAVEGTSYEDLYKAADLLCLTLLKMLCGSPDCPDAAACASGGSCGCG
ncbi:MAG: hypothetical protein ACC645_21330 [Pirellulales bacterium]